MDDTPASDMYSSAYCDAAGLWVRLRAYRLWDSCMELRMLAPTAYARTGEADPIRYYRLPVIGRMFRRRIEKCISLLPSGQKVLELGYGSGVSFLSLAEKFHEIHGIDVHPNAGAVRASFASEDLRPQLRQGTIWELPYESNSFDAALAISIHEELPPERQAAAFREVHRVVRPGGCYVVGVPGVHFLMNTAFYLLGCNIRKYHLTTEGQVLRGMSVDFDVDALDYSPKLLPRSLTTYVCMRGWKR